MNQIMLLGLLAGTLTTASFIPQVIKTWRTRSASDLSTEMFSVFCGGVTLWLIYGVAVRDVPIVVANAITLILAGAILVMKLKYH
jgi:MtN3 and saliva related transmembrane protein